MTVLLFSLRNVPEDEAFEVRELLINHDINFYETSAGNWGIGVPALWLADRTQLPQAQELLNAYQQQRALTQREIYLTKCKLGEQATLLKNLKLYPTRSITYILAALAIIYLSGKFIFALGF